MAKKNRPHKKSVSAGPERSALAILVALGAASGMWAVFQWGELLVSRAGGDTFCNIDSTFDCRAIWDSGLASLIHDLSGVPVAGWGVIWGVVAMALPLWLLSREDGQRRGPAWTAAILNAAVGLVSVGGFALSSFREGYWCLTCLVTYVVVTAYVLLTYYQWRKHGAAIERRGFGLAGACTLAVYLLLLIPGLRTPGAAAKEGLAALKGAQTETAVPETGPKTETDQRLERFIAELSPQMQQALSDAITSHRAARDVPLRPPRKLIGQANAALRITEFTDALCGHCANLHQTISELRRILPTNAFSLEMRQFPLDSACNAALDGPSQYPIRCFAAKAQICFESTEHGVELASSIFANGRQLNEEVIFELAAKHMPREQLQSCIDSAETKRKLDDDVAWAVAHDIEGTPLVLLDGREGTQFGPFLYAMALTHRRTDHPAFASLPKGRVLTGHEGHGHD